MSRLRREAKDQLIFVCEDKEEAQFIRSTMKTQTVYMDLRAMLVNIVEQSDNTFWLMTFNVDKPTMERATVWANAQWSAFQRSREFMEALSHALKKPMV